MNPSESADRSQIHLKRAINLPTGILLVAGIMIGSGVFKKIAPMSHSLMSEPAILAAWITAGVDLPLGGSRTAGRWR